MASVDLQSVLFVLFYHHIAMSLSRLLACVAEGGIVPLVECGLEVIAMP